MTKFVDYKDDGAYFFMINQQLQVEFLKDLGTDDYQTLRELIIEIWQYNEWVTQSDVIPMADLFLSLALTGSSKIFVCRHQGKIVGVISALIIKNFKMQLFLKSKELSSISLLVNGGRPVTTFDYYLETEKLNNELLRKSGKNFQASLELFVLKEEFRGCGLGNLLYNAFLSYLAKHGITHFYLLTDSSSNYKFYEHKGLKRIEEQRFYWGHTDGTGFEDYYVYEGFLKS
jgi:GNAT superfamily N-acetyltransferase